MNVIQFCSLNVNGLRGWKKQQAVLEYLKHKHKGVLMLQETHTDQESEKYWSEISEMNYFFSHGSTNAKGVAILLPKDYGLIES